MRLSYLQSVNYLRYVAEVPTARPDLMSRLRARVLTLMQERGWNYSEFAAAVGHKPAWASMFFSGDRGIPLTTVEQIAKAFNVDPLVLFDEPAAPVATLDGFTTVPLLKSRIAAGTPLVVQPDAEVDQQLSFSAGLTRKYPGCLCLRVGPREESMVPTILPGDVVLLDRQPQARLRPRSGGIFAVNYARLDGNDGSAVKRIELVDGVLVVSSDNPDKSHYPTLAKPLDDLNLLEVLVGEVVWHGRYLTPRGDKTR